MKEQNRWITMTVLTLALCLTLSSAAPQTENHSFAAKKTLKLALVSGDCRIVTGNANKIVVKVEYTFDKEEYTPKFEEQGDLLLLKEKFTKGSCNGESKWEISLPAGTAVEFCSASGNLDLEGCQSGVTAKTASGDFVIRNVVGKISLHTASGDIELENMKGELYVRTASGDISLKKISGEIDVKSASGEISIEDSTGKNISCTAASGEINLNKTRGALHITCASGNIQAGEVSLEDESSFKAASGNVAVTLSAPLKSDITVASASGDAVLDFNGQAMNGRFEMSAKKGRPIIAPFTFDKEEEFEKNDQTYVRKNAERKASSPVIVVKTASGKAEIKK